MAAPAKRRIDRVFLACAACLVGGLAGRAALLSQAPAHSFLLDHLDYLAWGQRAAERGPAGVYDADPLPGLVTRVPPRYSRSAEPVALFAPNACNYPPGSIYLFWLQGTVWRALDSELRTAVPDRRMARHFGHDGSPITSRLANSHLSRWVIAAPALALDVLLALGVAALVATAARDRADARVLAAIAFCVCILAPPIALNSAFWNQTDAWVCAPLVWTLVLLAQRRFAWSGAVYGAALLVKAQAILLAPVLLFAWLAILLWRDGPGASGGATAAGDLPKAGEWRPAAWSGLGAFVLGWGLVVAAGVAPFVADGAMREHGDPWRWLQRGYLDPILKHHDQTTLNAYNLWWLDFLATGRKDTAEPLLGLRRDALGKLLLAGVILLAGGWCWRRWGGGPAAWVALGCVVLLAAFALPTRVHDRYIYYCLPLLISAAACYPRYILPAAAIVIVGSVEMSWFLWYDEGPLPESMRLPTAVMAVLVLGSLAWCVGCCVVAPPRVRRGALATLGRVVSGG
ncbi:MAG: hypothetical protein HRU75_10615 [Planctomycetia bacterium]|nr:MAG: hypothetical protein HRU75_10615 [Planctomycetia bacterium]